MGLPSLEVRCGGLFVWGVRTTWQTEADGEFFCAGVRRRPQLPAAHRHAESFTLFDVPLVHRGTVDAVAECGACHRRYDLAALDLPHLQPLLAMLRDAVHTVALAVLDRRRRRVPPGAARPRWTPCARPGSSDCTEDQLIGLLAALAADEGRLPGAGSYDALADAVDGAGPGVHRAARGAGTARPATWRPQGRERILLQGARIALADGPLPAGRARGAGRRRRVPAAPRGRPPPDCWKRPPVPRASTRSGTVPGAGECGDGLPVLPPAGPCRPPAVAVGENGPMTLFRDEGVVLRTQKLGEADRIITLLTRQHGRVRAVGQGVRTTKSKFGARLEPFTPRRRAVLARAASWSAAGCRCAPRSRRSPRTAAASSPTTPATPPARRCWRRPSGSPTTRASRPSSSTCCWSARLRTLAARRARRRAWCSTPSCCARWPSTATAPSFDDCARCGAARAATGSSRSPAGGVGVRGLPGARRRRTLAPETLDLLGALLTGDWADRRRAASRGTAREGSGLVAAYLQWHLERGLRSLPLRRDVAERERMARS